VAERKVSVWWYVGGAAAVVAFLTRSQLARVAGMVIDKAKIPLFKAVIPDAAGPYAETILDEAGKAGIDPFVVVALGDRETKWGTAPSYKGQTGDFAARCWSKDQIDKFGPERLRVGAACSGGFLVTPYDGLGWGRGLMQIDFGSEADWLFANDWRDPATNIRKGISILQQKMRELSSTGYLSSSVSGDGYVHVSDAVAALLTKNSDYDVPAGDYADPRPFTGSDLFVASLAAYNAGSVGVIRAVATMGMDGVDAVTTNNYSSDVSNMIASLTAAFQAQVGTA